MPLQGKVGVSNPQQQRGIADTLLDLVDPAGIRMKVSNLLPGGISSLISGRAPTTSVVDSRRPNNPTAKDWRVKLSLPPSNNMFYNDQSNQLLTVLARTGGVIFPYTPNISVTHNARYQETALTHNNYKNYFYDGSDVGPITITGDFTVQNDDDGLYLLAVIYFFRSCTKMFFGKDTNAGNPPPVVYLDGYGDFYFPHVSCVVTSFQHTMPPEVDYLEFKYNKISTGSQLVYENDGSSSKVANTVAQIARLPTTSQITVTVQPVYSRSNIHNNMSLEAFSRGTLLNKGFL